MTILRHIDFETTTELEKGGEIIEAGTTDVELLPSGDVIIHPTVSHLFSFTGEFHAAGRQAHHIHPDMLKGYPIFTSTDAACLLLHPDTASGRVDYLVAHNMEFEKGYLTSYKAAPLPPLICTMKVARRVWPSAESFSLQFLRYHADVENGSRDERCHPPHRAGPDTRVNALLTLKILDCHVTPDEMVAYTSAPTFYQTCPIGKWKGSPWHRIDSGFLVWMAYKAPDMDPDLKSAAQFELASRKVT